MEMNNDGTAGLGNSYPSVGEPWPRSGKYGQHQWPPRLASARPARETNLPPMNEDIFASDMWDIFDAAGELLLKKHESYGPGNIGNAPGGPENGLRVRMHDKMARMNHILDNPNVDTNDESLTDTLMDLLNYCAIFIMVRNGKWPDTRN